MSSSIIFFLFGIVSSEICKLDEKAQFRNRKTENGKEKGDITASFILTKLFNRNHIVINRLSTVLKLDITVGIDFGQIIPERFCILLVDIRAKINTD